VDENKGPTYGDLRLRIGEDEGGVGSGKIRGGRLEDTMSEGLENQRETDHWNY
jgi:hypothetical protein